jgi:hypothetical protein
LNKIKVFGIGSDESNSINDKRETNVHLKSESRVSQFMHQRAYINWTSSKQGLVRDFFAAVAASETPPLLALEDVEPQCHKSGR